MIDVVFLLLVFFMLASRFGVDMHLPLKSANAGAGTYQGPPRLVDITPGAVRLNGVPVKLDALADALTPLMSAPSDPVILRARDGAALQDLVDVMGALDTAGFSGLVMVE